MITGIKFVNAIGVPTRKTLLTYYNAKDDGAQLQVEETQAGILLHVGSINDGKFVRDGRTVRVPWHMVEYIHETREAKK